MKVALLHYSSSPVIGGVEHVLEKHAQLFSADGYEVTVICGTGESPPTSKGAPIHLALIPELAASHPKVRAVHAELAAGNADGEYRALRDFLFQRLRPLVAKQEVIILHNVCTMPFHLPLTETLWQLANEFPQARFICWIHDLAALNPDYSIPQGAPWNFLRQANQHFEYVAVSELRQRQFIELTGINSDKCPVIPNGIDPIKELALSNSVAHLTSTLDLLDSDIILLQPTRLLLRKNVELSLHVAAALRDLGVRVCLLITGAPDPHNAAAREYAARLLSLRDALHLHTLCHFVGELFEVTDDDIRSLYQVADALFFPSHQEGFGLPMLEAALYRVPAFCADIEPLRDLPGATPFSREAKPAEIASLIIRQMQAWPANSPRKAVVRNYAWSVIYRNCLAPLLKRHKELRHP